jgi:hypothetical protein
MVVSKLHPLDTQVSVINFTELNTKLLCAMVEWENNKNISPMDINLKGLMILILGCNIEFYT